MFRCLLSVVLCLAVLPAAAVDMSLKDLDGKTSRLSDFHGKWVVANYWASWCPPCIEEMPELQAFHDDHVDKDAVVLGFNSEFMPADDIKGFLDQYFITYPNYSMGPVSNTPLGQVPGLPTTFLISPEGDVVARQVGKVTAQMIETFIAKWEAKKSGRNITPPKNAQKNGN